MFLDTDDCRDVTCSDHGACIDMMNDYRCNCDPDYTGPNCETSKDTSCINLLACVDLVSLMVKMGLMYFVGQNVV